MNEGKIITDANKELTAIAADVQGLNAEVYPDPTDDKGAVLAVRLTVLRPLKIADLDNDMLFDEVSDALVDMAQVLIAAGSGDEPDEKKDKG